jgi:hypothetical protein
LSFVANPFIFLIGWAVRGNFKLFLKTDKTFFFSLLFWISIFF